MDDNRYKPRGTSGHVRVTIKGGERPEKAFVEDKVGHSKPDIEQTILNQFCAAMRRNGATIFSARPKRENDLDFEIETPGGNIDLELTEFLPRSNGPGKPYKPGHYSSTMGEEADRLLATIQKKDKHYGRPSRVPVHLIVYPTDFSTRVCPEVLSLLRIALAENPPQAIENVFWVQVTEIEEQQLSVFSHSTRRSSRLRSAKWSGRSPSPCSIRHWPSFATISMASALAMTNEAAPRLWPVREPLGWRLETPDPAGRY